MNYEWYNSFKSLFKKTESEQEERFLFQDRKMENGNKLREKVKLNDWHEKVSISF